MAAKKAPVWDLETALAALKERATQAQLDGMARYAIPSDRAFGVAMRDVQTVAKSLGKNHALAAELWASGWYEARLLACYVDDPTAVTAKQMDDWCRDFDNWAVVDTVCFALFKRSPHAWRKVEAWSSKKDEFQRRGAFALLWALAGRDGGEEPFYRGLELIEQAATDERNFVKKAVNMALRAIGKRNLPLHTAATATAKRLGASEKPASRWIGKDALKEPESPKVVWKLGHSK
ncbi:DNA alkylation repair protein [Luteolibacter arcticus]|uniref:DNA alkylation repair protein n=1 Tax=Luteolibacter arcticus TaxID=1581411 RepID=A0ABT3GC42_9BACT|nr:DNA alkylation repair protein [Luteolibacter arcticus]MCW1921203.1 DNA alkylation repair protein [Luteolibacter arcticus]